MATDGAVTITESTFDTIKLVSFAWASGADGGVNGFTTKAAFSGAVLQVVTVPGTGGTQPSAYALSVLDQNGIDVMAGAGTARSTTLTQYINSALGYVVSSTLSLVISGAGSGKSGTVYVYIR